MEVIVPIFCGAVLPIAIVLIVFIASMNKDNKQSQVLIKAIEASNGVDADKLVEAFRKPVKTERQILNLRLLRGCIFSLIGLFLIVIGIVSFATGSNFSDDPVTGPMVLGGVSLAIGISYLIVYFVSRKQVETEEKDK